MFESIVWLLSGVMVILTITVHYEVMAVTSDRIIPWTQKRMQSRRVIAFAIAALLLGHIFEIWLFALAMKLLLCFPSYGYIQGNLMNSFGDYLYLSTVSYTTLGDNSVHLAGSARALAASESLVGMMMVFWSASFAYLKMKMIWERRRTRRD